MGAGWLFLVRVKSWDLYWDWKIVHLMLLLLRSWGQILSCCTLFSTEKVPAFFVKTLAKLPVFDTSLCTFSRQLTMVCPQFFDRFLLSCNNGFSQTAFWHRPIASKNRPSVNERASLPLSSEALWEFSKVTLDNPGIYCQERQCQPFCWTKDFWVKLISHPGSNAFFVYQEHGLNAASWWTSNVICASIAT